MRLSVNLSDFQGDSWLAAIERETSVLWAIFCLSRKGSENLNAWWGSGSAARVRIRIDCVSLPRNHGAVRLGGVEIRS